MGRPKFGRVLSAGVPVLMVALMAACAAVNPRSSEDIVRERAQAREVTEELRRKLPALESLLPKVPKTAPRGASPTRPEAPKPPSKAD